MRARLAGLALSLEGKQRLTLELLEDFREEYDRLGEAELEVTIKRHRKRRSLDANAYFWVLCDRLAEATGIPKTEIYRQSLREIGGNSETVCVVEAAAERLREGWEHNGLGWITEAFPSKLPGCVNITLYYGSSTYDRGQMSRLIDNIVQDCKAAGIETLPPERLWMLTEQWGDNERKAG